MKKIITVLLLLISFFIYEEIPELGNVLGEINPELVYVARVIDGDTIELSTGKKVRYIGVNTPELNAKSEIEKCFALRAKKYNESLVLGKQVELVSDVNDTDRYGRLLRYVYVTNTNTNNTEKIFVNAQLVEQGYAYASAYPPDVSYQDLFSSLQSQAEVSQAGLWGEECEI